MIATIITIIALIIYWGIYFLITHGTKHTSLKFHVGMRLIGVLLFGTAPFLVTIIMKSDISYTYISNDQWMKVALCLILGIPVIIFINGQISKRASHQEMYPPIRINEWHSYEFLLNIFSWGIYLLSYEFMFRGFLLMECISSLGVFYAITINTVIYAIAHLPKGKFETIGAIPLGVVFCLITIYTGTFWTVFVLHATIAVSTDVFCIWRNPEMSVIKK